MKTYSVYHLSVNRWKCSEEFADFDEWMNLKSQNTGPVFKGYGK